MPVRAPALAVEQLAKLIRFTDQHQHLQNKVGQRFWDTLQAWYSLQFCVAIAVCCAGGSCAMKLSYCHFHEYIV